MDASMKKLIRKLKELAVLVLACGAIIVIYCLV